MNNEKEKEIWLAPDEIKQLLEGGLYWNDIESKISPESIHTFRRSLEIDDLNAEETCEQDEKNKPEESGGSDEPDEAEDVRAILLGENFSPQKFLVDEGKKALETKRSIEIKREIEEKNIEDLTGGEVKAESLWLFAANQEDQEAQEERGIGLEEKDSFGGIKEILLSDDSELQEKPTFGGLKLVALLIIAALTTFGVWYYFVSR